MQEPNNIETLLSSVKDGTIAIPIYQRMYTWNIRQVVKLFNFMVESYDATTNLQRIPLSPFLLATSSEEEKTQPVTFSGSFEDLPERYYLIVDGRQRTDSLFRAYNGEFDGIMFYNTKLKHFHHSKRVNSNPFIDVPVSILMDSRKWNVYRRKLIAEQKGDDLFDELSMIRERIMHFKVHTQTAHDLSFDDQISWFNTVNREGTKLSKDDEIIAKATHYGILFRKTLDEVSNVFAKNNLTRKHFMIRSHYELSSDLVLMLPTIFNKLASTKDKGYFMRLLQSPAFEINPNMQKNFQRRLHHHPVVLDRALQYINQENLLARHKMNTMHLGFVLRMFISEDLQSISTEQKRLLTQYLNAMKNVEMADYAEARNLYNEFNDKLIELGNGVQRALAKQ